jgi:hypothetical protein
LTLFASLPSKHHSKRKEVSPEEKHIEWRTQALKFACVGIQRFIHAFSGIPYFIDVPALLSTID